MDLRWCFWYDSVEILLHNFRAIDKQVLVGVYCNDDIPYVGLALINKMLVNSNVHKFVSYNNGSADFSILWSAKDYWKYKR